MYADGRGLYLQVVSATNRSWIYRYTVGKKQNYMGLGPLADVSLDRARELASEARQQRKRGIDPLAAKKRAQAALQLAAGGNKSFKECAEAYVAAQASKGAEWADVFLGSFAKYVYPICGKLQVADIDNAVVLRCLDPIWQTNNPTARRVRNRMEDVLNWAKVLGYRAGDNPAAWAGNLEHVLEALPKATAPRYTTRTHTSL